MGLVQSEEGGEGRVGMGSAVKARHLSHAAEVPRCRGDPARSSGRPVEIPRYIPARGRNIGANIALQWPNSHSTLWTFRFQR